jgi:FkbM family methyltransferase
LTTPSGYGGLACSHDARVRLRRVDWSTALIAMTLPQECIIAENCYGLYCLPLQSRQRPASVEIINGRVWEPKTIETICSSARSGDVIHAGAFFGDFLPAISRALGPAAKVWAFEPNSQNFQAAIITCRLNELKNVELRQCGLSERSGHRELLIGQSETWFGGGSRIVHTQAAAGDHTETIAVKSIDAVVPPDRQVSVLQLDVEGHEMFALSGGYETIRRCLPLIILETLPDNWVGKNLMPLGYRVIGRCNENFILSTIGTVVT